MEQLHAAVAQNGSGNQHNDRSGVDGERDGLAMHRVSQVRPTRLPAGLTEDDLLDAYAPRAAVGGAS